LRRARDDAGLIPGHGAVELRERPTVEHRPRRDPDLVHRHFQTHPLARRRQWPNLSPLRRLVRAELNQILAPERPVLPVAAAPLQHDLARRLLRVDVYVSEEHVALADEQAGAGVGEEMLTLALRGALMGLFAAEDRVIGLRHEVPFAIFAAIA